MKAVVVGGLGMIGSAVARELLGRGVHTLVVDLHERPDLGHVDATGSNPLLSYKKCDVRNLANLIGALSGADQVYHLAGELGTSDMDDDVRGAVETNILGTLNVLDACVVNKVGRLFNPTKPQVWLNTYTITKTCTEGFCTLYNKLHADRLTVTQLRYFNAYGRDQHLTPVRKIVPAFLLQALHGLPIEVFGDGTQTVDMVHVDDMARVTVDLTTQGYNGPPLDCGSGVERTVLSVARDVNEVCGNHAGVTFLPMRRGEDPHTRLVADTRPMRRELNSLYLTTWRNGLAATAREVRSLPRAELDRALKFYGWQAK
jgi:UDP-glucose 4-epimerase